MTAEIVTFLIILFCMVAVFLSGKLPYELTAFTTLLILYALNYLTTEDIFSGFTSSSVIVFVSTFFLAGSLKRTGVSDFLAYALAKKAGNNEQKNITLVMLIGAGVSAFISNVAAVALLLPAVVSIAKINQIHVSRLLIPLAFAVLVGGEITLIGSTANIVAADLMAQSGNGSLSFFEFAPFGITFVFIAIIFMVFWGYKWLPRRNLLQYQDGKKEIRKAYRLNEELFCLRVKKNSSLVGQTLAESNISEIFGVRVVAIFSGDDRRIYPRPEQIININDRLLVYGSMIKVKEIEQVEILSKTLAEDLESADINITEVVLSPRSSLIGKSLLEIGFREKYDFQVLAIWRDGRPLRKELAHQKLKFGDALLLQGPRSKFQILDEDHDFLLLYDHSAPERKNKAVFSIFAFLLMILLASFKIVPVTIAALIAALIVIFSGALKIDEAYNSVSWGVVFLVAALIPIGKAFQTSGAAAYISDLLLATTGNISFYLSILVLALAASLISQLLDAVIAVILVGQIALSLAEQSGANPHALLMTVTLAASIAFLTSFSHKANLLVMGAGGYRNIDYFRVGSILTLLLISALIVLIAVVY